MGQFRPHFQERRLFTFPELKLTRDDVKALKPDYIYITGTPTRITSTRTRSSCFRRTSRFSVSWYPENNFTERNVKALGFTDVRVADPEKGLR